MRVIRQLREDYSSIDPLSSGQKSANTKTFRKILVVEWTHLAPWRRIGSRRGSVCSLCVHVDMDIDMVDMCMLVLTVVSERSVRYPPDLQYGFTVP